MEAALDDVTGGAMTLAASQAGGLRAQVGALRRCLVVERRRSLRPGKCRWRLFSTVLNAVCVKNMEFKLLNLKLNLT